MSSYTNKGYSYGRQMSDTQFYNNRRKVDINDEGRGQRTASHSASVKEIRNGSSRNRYDVNCPSPGYNHSRRLQNDFYSTGIDHRSSNGINGPGSNVLNKRSENVVRFHKDVVTDVQEMFTNKIHVDDIESNYSGRSAEHIGDANEMVDLQSTSYDQRERALSFDEVRQSSEHNRAIIKPVGHRKESKRTKETKFCNGKDTPVTSNGYSINAGGDNQGNGGHYSNNKHIVQNEPVANVRNVEEDRKRQHSSKRRRHPSKSLPNSSKNDNRSKTKTALHKTRSSSSTESSQNGKIKHDNGLISKDMKLCLTKTDSNSSSTRKSTKSHSDQVELKLQFENKGELARKKRRKTCCVILSLITTIFVVVAMVLGAVLFIQSKGTQKDSLDRQRVYDMVNVHVRFRVLNRKYNSMFQNNSSPQFNTFSVQLCNEVDVIYMTSHVSHHYYGCKVRSLRAGSVRVYYVSQFLATTDTSNTTLHREILLNNPTTVISPAHPVNTTFLGDFLIDVNSIEIAIEMFQTTKLPQKPLMPFIRVTSTQSIQHEYGKSTPLSRQTTQSLLDKDIATTAPVKLASTNVSKSTTPKTGEPLSTAGTGTSTMATLVNTDDWPIEANTDSNIHYDQSTSYSTITDLGHSTTNYSGTDIDTPIDIGTTKPVVNETSLNKTSISARGDSVFLMKQSARVECIVNNSNTLTSLIVQHRDFWGNDVVLIDVSTAKLNSQKDLSDTLSAKKTLSVIFRPDSIKIHVDFTEVNCEDVGVYTCVVKTRTGEELRADSVLNGTAEPGMPQLSVPIALIENTEIKQPIMCTADVGFPNGELQWMVKPKGSDEFFEFPGHLTSQSGRCKNFVTNSLIYTPTKDGNGTLLKCEVVNKHVPHPPDLTAVTDLYILPENMCDGVLINRTIRHPFTCMKYIRCLGNSFEVKECVNKMCYDEESARCGQTKLRMTDVVAYLNEGVTSVQCRLDHLGVWSNITISKLDAMNRKEPIASVFSVSSTGNEIIIHETSMKDRVFVHKESSQDFEIKINLWLYVLTCADEGEYICEAFTPTDHKMATGRIDLRGKPEAPKIIVPNEMVEGMPTRHNVTCQANVGYPEGRLVFKIKLQNETEFHPIRFNVTTEETIQNCSKVLRKSFTFTPALRHEKAELLCEVENKYTLPVNKKLVAKEVVHIVPKNFCLTHGSGTPHVHPHDCHQYVQCSQGYIYVQRCGSDHCFNPHTLHCDIKVKDKDVPFDPKHPCLPDKNGVFFHHPILCNKYIWCVQGHEVVHHCPLGTLYIDGGQCTFEPERSRCYNTDKVEQSET